MAAAWPAGLLEKLEMVRFIPVPAMATVAPAAPESPQEQPTKKVKAQAKEWKSNWTVAAESMKLLEIIAPIPFPRCFKSGEAELS